MRRLAVLLLVTLLVPVSAADAKPRLRERTVAQWARFDAVYVPDVVPDNPFDPAEIDVRAEFDPPGSAPPREVPAFWFQDYDRALVGGQEQLTPVGAPHFRLRFTPHLPGLWRWRWIVRGDGEVRVLPWEHLRVKKARDHGFLRISAHDPRFVAFDDGSPYFAVGENTGWYDQRGTFAYDDWFGALAAQGANFGRLWMSSWAFGIEWNDTGLGDYTNRLDRAWQLDRVIEEAEARDIFVMLAFLNHGAFSTVFNPEWAQNPYNAANGGPLSSPGEFFTHAEARRLFEQRLRYIVARWGWSTHVMAWEFWNEVDLTTGGTAATIASWHADMAAFLRALDPFDHLITTSHAIFVNQPLTWNVAGIDFTQLHFYADPFPLDFKNVSRNVVQWTRDRIAATGKPVLFGELGVDSRGPAETRANDPEGIGIHDGLWAGVVSEGIGTAMPWWWDNLIAVEPDRYYPMFGAVSRFVDRVRWDREHFSALEATVAGTAGRPVVAHGLRGDKTLLVWLKDDAFQWYAPNAATISGATLHLTGRWCGRWYDPWTGAWLDSVEFRDQVALPPFSRDLALRARRC